MNLLGLMLFAIAAVLLWSRNVRFSIILLAIEGGLLSLMVSTSGHLTLSSAFVALATLAIKAGLIPTVLYRMMRTLPVEVRKDQPLPLWAYAAGIVVVLGAGHIIQLLGPSELVQNKLTFFCGLSSVYLGMVMIVARRHLLSQIAALVSIENGLVLLGVSLAGSLPVFVELGILADLAIAVTLLVWMSHRIHKIFQTADVVSLQHLKG